MSSESKTKPEKQPTVDRATLGHSTRHLPGHEIRWNGPRGAVVVYDLNEKPLKVWQADENRDGKALLAALRWVKAKLAK